MFQQVVDAVQRFDKEEIPQEQGDDDQPKRDRAQLREWVIEQQIRRIVENNALEKPGDHKLAARVLGRLSATVSNTLLESVVAAVWTAVETLLTDLWIAAVDSRPKTLGMIAIRGAARRGATTGTGDSIAIKVHALEKYGSAATLLIGTVLHGEQEYTFNSPEDIRTAYENAFGIIHNGDLKVPQAVKAWFSGNDYESIRLIAAIRHVCVHRAGCADRKFLERMSSIKHALASLAPGERIPLDGPMVCDLFAAAVRFSIHILEGVDTWLQSNAA